MPQSDIRPAPRRIRIDGRQAAAARPFEADANVVSDAYLDTLGVPLLFLAGALAAALGPARRATAVDTLIALKAD